MESQVKLILVNDAHSVLYLIPIVESDETFQDPESKIVWHLPLSALENLPFFSEFLPIGILIGLLVGDRLKKLLIMELHQPDLLLDERINFIKLIFSVNHLSS